MNNKSNLYFCSACYASKGQWQLSLDDAQLCISKDTKFIKGYYRLCVAQLELNLFDDSIATVKAALDIEPENELMIKQMRLIRTKRNTAMQTTVTRPRKQLGIVCFLYYSYSILFLNVSFHAI